ncbi:MAG TPA: YlxM family DNA-binding protein [Thermaerobacter sp.]
MTPRDPLDRDRPEAGLARTLRLHALFDLYGGLLTERQREVFELYHLYDLSLAEVAEHLQVSRQAVHDLLRRAEAALEQAEAALGALARRTRRQRRLRRLAALLRQAEAELAGWPGHDGAGAGGGPPVDRGSTGEGAGGAAAVPRAPAAAASPELPVRRLRRLLARARRLARNLLADTQGGV